MKHMRKLLLLCVVCAVCVAWIPTLCVAAFTGSTPPPVTASRSITVNIKTVIDNAGELSGSAANGTYSYGVIRTVQMAQTGATVDCFVPKNNTPKTFSWKNGGVSTVEFNNSSRNKNCDLLRFEPAATTDRHISLNYIEIEEESGAVFYTYTNGGKASPSVEAFNWIDIGNVLDNSVNVTLHFRYNPDIEDLPPPPDPEPDYTKKIDYLGDGVPNPDTAASGVNDYRIYLTLDTAPPAEEPTDKDIIFILDISYSMFDNNMGNVRRITKMAEVVNGAVETLLNNHPDNRISLVSFDTSAVTLIKHSSNIMELKGKVNDLAIKKPTEPTETSGYRGGTNYYQAFEKAGKIVSELVDPSRETVVFFLTDGEPTGCLPAVSAIGTTDQAPVALIYADYAAKAFPAVDRLYSVFIGSDKAPASTLQTITQHISVNIEKFMVQAASQTELETAMKRILSQIDDSLSGVTIEDVLSEYVDYIGEPKVTKSFGNGESVLLKNGTDYAMNYDSSAKRIQMSLLENASADTHYTLSFNVCASSAALDYGDNFFFNYPNVGDEDTDYAGNDTSSGKPGLYSNANATLTYSFGGGSGQSVRTYPKPVIQVVSPNAVPTEISVRKELEGMPLEEGMFSFELYSLQEMESEEGGEPELTEVLVDTAVNGADGSVVFENVSFARPGEYTFLVREMIPEESAPGMTYDDKEIEIKVLVTRKGDALNVEVNYPSEAVFVNRYEPQPVTVPIGVKKELSGHALSAGMFKFQLLTNNSESVEVVANDAKGDVTFTPITFYKAGTYKYMIRESVPSPVNPHVTYDLKTIYAVITVTDNNAVLSARVQYSPDNVFRNQFAYQPTTATIEVTKVLTGMQLTTGMFEFELKDNETGKSIVKRNLADGRVLFDLEYAEPGTHTYTLREIVPADPIEHMTYDDKTITVTVEVTEDEEGELITAVSFRGEPVFYNSYQVRGGIW